MNVYKGKEPCPGCGRTGEEMPRLNKSGLCGDCEETLMLGKALVKERDLKRKNYILDDLTIAYLQWYSIPLGDIHAALKDLLNTFSQFDKRNAGIHSHIPQERYLAGYAGSGTSADTIVLPNVTFDAAKRLTQLLKDVCWKLKTDRDNYKQQIEEQYQNELRQEKNRIYNEGVSYGRNLLMQLNRGEISVYDFEKPAEYKQQSTNKL